MAWIRMTGGNSAPSILNILEKTPLGAWTSTGTLSTNITNNNPLSWTNSSGTGDSILSGKIVSSFSYDVSKYATLLLSLSIAIQTYNSPAAYPAKIQIIAKGEITGTEYALKTINFTNNGSVQRSTITDEYVNISNVNLPTTEKYYIGILVDKWYTKSTSQNQSVSKLTLIK